MCMKIAIGCDHGGFALKEELRKELEKEGYVLQDFGCFSTESTDYPIYAFAAAEAVARGEAERGIVICTTGIGVSICANKVKGIRCALCGDPVSARLTREHNDANMLALGAGTVSLEQAREITAVWLKTPFSQGERHKRRIALISKYESK